MKVSTLPAVTILEGDALARLREMPDESVQCCVTSPPYWGLRDYGVIGQIGSEKSPEKHIAVLVEIFSEVRRVLRNDGTLWVNYGDAYASSWPCHRRNVIGNGSLPNGKRNARSSNLHGDIKEKDLMGLPWMVAFALRSDGWYLRQDIIWHKPNPMPESCRDRCTKAHEYMFLLTKRPRYYYDAAAIRDPLAEKTFTTFGSVRKGNGGGELVASDNWSRDVPVRKPKEWKMPDGWETGRGAHGSIHCTGREKGKTRGHQREHEGVRDKWDDLSKEDQQAFGANKRSVWTVATAPFRQAHFATFPPGLIKPCILAGTKPGDMVLDPFGGSGTTGMVALELGRSATLIELNPSYAAMARRRSNVTPGFAL